MKKNKLFVLLLSLVLLIIPFRSFAENDIWTNEEILNAYQESEGLSSDDIALINTKLNVYEGDTTLHLSQLWSVNNEDGTEWYIPMQELNGQSIENLRVRAYIPETDTNFIEFETSDDWDINASFNEKAFKAGLNFSNGYPEICFGKSSMGRVVYEISYDLTEAVKKSADGVPFIFQKVVNDSMNPAPRKIALTLNVDDKKADTKIWGFGFLGDLKPFNDNDFKTDYVDFGSSNRYVTILSTMQGSDNSKLRADSRTVEEIKKQAFKGSDYDLNPDGDDGDWKWFDYLFKVINVLLRMLPPFLIFTFIKKLMDERRNKYVAKNIKDIKIEKDHFSREIPFSGSIAETYFMYDMKNYMSSQTNLDFLSAFILKWIKSGNINPIIEDRVKDNKLELNNDPVKFESTLEEETWNILRDASKNGILTRNNLKKYVEKRYKKIKEMVEDSKDDVKVYLEAEGLIEYDEKGKRFSFTENGKESYINTFGFKKYLEEFTIINEREPKEVTLWDYYLIFASLFGIASEVEKQFEKLVPSYVFAEDPTSPTYGTVRTAQYVMFADSFSSSASSGYSAAVQRSRSSGSGGFSSSGGGGGSSGGGSGGGSR